MSTAPVNFKTISATGATYICTIGKNASSVTLMLSGTFGGTSAQVGYLNKADDSVEPYNAAASVDTAAFEYTAIGGHGTKVYVTCTGGSGLDIDVNFGYNT